MEGADTKSKLRVTVYTPDSSLRHPLSLLQDMLKDLAASRELAWRLAVRDLSAQYRQAALGFLWAFILPLANTAVWLFLKGAGIVSIGGTTLPYAAYLFTGTMLWSIFMDAMNAPLQLATTAKLMLAKLNFPREALVVSGIYQTLFNALIRVGLMLGALIAMGVQPGWSLLMVPLGVLSLILAGTTIGVMLTPIGLLYTDVGKSLPMLFQFLMYMTPVVFPMPSGGWAAVVVGWNPLTPLVVTARDWLAGLPPEMIGPFLVVNVVMAALLLVVWVVYRLAMPILIERMSA